MMKIYQQKKKNQLDSHFYWSICQMFCSFGVLLLAIFLRTDCDLYLTLLSSPPELANKGRTVWIIGASSGIGAQLAIDYTRSGATVILSARREEKLREVAHNCSLVGEEKIMILPLDVTRFDDHQVAFDHILKAYGKLDVLVLNAGIALRMLANETEITKTEKLFQLNFFSFIHLTKIVLPSMIQHKTGQIVVMSSLAGKIPVPYSSSYSATKFALHGYFNALRSEIGGDNIRVSIICPGPVESEIWDVTERDPKSKVHDVKKMTTDRCTEIILKGLYNNVEEMWIAEQPILSLAYFNEYFPFVSRYVRTHITGPQRVQSRSN